MDEKEAEKGAASEAEEPAAVPAVVNDMNSSSLTEEEVEAGRHWSVRVMLMSGVNGR